MEGEEIDASEFAALMLFMVACGAELPLPPPGEDTDCAEAHKVNEKGTIRKGVERFNQCIRHVHVEQPGEFGGADFPHILLPIAARKKIFRQG